MLRILLLSTIYPLPSKDNKGTAVCHFFTKEWVKMGHDVRVVHVQAVYPRVLYWMARLAQNRIAAKTGAVVYTHRDCHTSHYEMDGVPISRMPVYKPIPHGPFSSRAVIRAVEEIIEDNSKVGFAPDVIIGHFPNPQLEMVNLLKQKYPSARTCIVMHGDTDIMKKVYGKRLPQLMSGIDMWGFRSKTIREEFEATVGEVRNPFICYSGIPAKYIIEDNKHQFNGPLRHFVYVGGLVERKYPEKVVDALYKAYPNKAFTLSYIGDGQQASIITEKIIAYGLQKQVDLKGRMPRDQIVEQYDKADCMVMISRGEAYGLVYLEAMARGCITIASKREGFDGVIVNGENGFLCEAGNATELASLIQHINTLPSEELRRISVNAINTAKWLTDENVAKMYIKALVSTKNFQR